MRAPVAVFRLRLGWIFAGRLLMLTTVGRVSGKPRRTVLEVVSHDAATGSYRVIAGWGRGSDWFRNALAHPPLGVDVGARRFVPAVRELDVGEIVEVLAAYQRRYPAAAKVIGARLLDETFTDDEAGLRRIAEKTGALELIEPRVARADTN